MDSTAQTLRPAPSTAGRPTGTASGPASGGVPETPAGPVRRDAAVRAAAAAVPALALLPAWYWSVAGDAPGGALHVLARLAAVTAAVLLPVQVVLLSRTPLLERPFGLHRMLRLARLAGTASLALALAHAALVLPANGDPLDLLSRTPGLLLTAAILAAAALLWAAGLRLLRAARRKPSRGRRGRLASLLPLYAFLGMVLVLPQQLLHDSASFVPSTAARAFWWTLWGVAAGAFLAWRVLLPFRRHRRHRLRVASVVAEGHGVLSVTMTGRKLDRLRVAPGQFLVWRFLHPGTWRHAMPCSLSAAPDGSGLRISVRTRDGDGAAASVRSLRPGTPVWFTGPYGRFTARVRTRPRVALIGAGIGVAPLRALAEGLDYRPGEAVLLHRHSGGKPLFRREFTALVRRRGLEVVRLPGHRRAPGSWLGDAPGDEELPEDDLAALRSLVPDIAGRDVYLCGPGEWTAAVLRTLGAAGVPPRQIHTEPFRL
ncbi:hypothetical protein [Streptomyces sp. YIM 98790]|uniref:hypothetical protein n=1 Tax=Streptomyces sp. YIM 98790 TaxID=2689077 RepID=UPI001A9F7258|nr:hypothetical protein [Streptomyces sp. YIM 98790]